MFLNFIYCHKDLTIDKPPLFIHNIQKVFYFVFFNVFSEHTQVSPGLPMLRDFI